MTNKEKTFSAMNSAYLNTATMKINEDYLNQNLQIYLLNERSLYDSMRSNRHKATAAAWQALMFGANSRLDAEEYPKKYTATSDQLKSWLAEYGRGYDTIAETVEFIEAERKELAESK